jgi:putative methionine-R-sulfoxide reductase with GAF domain
LLGVLDIDSPQLARFDQDDAFGLKAAVDVFLQCSDLTAWEGEIRGKLPPAT